MKTLSDSIIASFAVVIFFGTTFIGIPSITAEEDRPVVTVTPNKGVLDEFERERPIRVTFPTPMVDLDKLHREGQPSPIIFEPTVEANWVWLSQTEGELKIPPVFVKNNVPEAELGPAEIFRVRHIAKLRPDLRDLAGNPVDTKNWGIEFGDDEFALENLEFLNVYDPRDHDMEWHEPDLPEKEEAEKKAASDQTTVERDEESDKTYGRNPTAPLPARPRLRLEFSRDVLPQEVVKAVYFLDRETNERFAVEVDLEERQKLAPQGWLLIEPANPLPPGRSFLFVIERLKEPAGGQTTTRTIAVPAGTTYAPEIKAVSAHNQPMKGTFVRVLANHSIGRDPSFLKAIAIEPSVSDLRLEPTGNGVVIFGTFGTSGTYKLTFKAGLLTDEGFPLAKDSAWEFTFSPKRPAIILPESYIFRRASTPNVGLSLVQVNTQTLDWKIAEIPRDKLAEVRESLREFGYFLRENEDLILKDENTGEYLYRPTELLLPKLNLQVVGLGSLDASADDLETLREFHWKPGNNDPGLFLLEVSGKDLQGRDIGNRAIISRGDWMVTCIDAAVGNKEESESGTIVRVNSMNDGKPVKGVRVELLGGGEPNWGDDHSPAEEDQEPPAQVAETDANGEVAFEGEIGGGDNPHMSDAILVGEVGRQCLQLATLPYFPSGYHASQSWRHASEGTLCTIVTDRNIYRPGETVKFKGFIRGSTEDGKLSIASDVTIACEIYDEGDTVIEEFEALVSRNGSFEGEWKIPTSAYGDYFFKVSGIGTLTKVTVAEFRPPPFSVVTDAEDAVGDTARVKIGSNLFHGAPNAGARVRWKAEWIVDDWRRDKWFAYGVERSHEEDQRFALVLNDEHSPDSPTRGFSEQVVDDLAKAGWATAREDRGVRAGATAQGEIRLDAQGRGVVECKSPFPPDAIYSRVKVYWIVDVTSADTAQTVRGGTSMKLQFVPQILGVNLEGAGRNKLNIQIGSFDGNDHRTSGLAAKAEVFAVEMRTVKERIAETVHRYRNFPDFKKVWEGNFVTPAQQTIPVSKGGKYVLRVTAPQQPRTPQVSDAVMLEDDRETWVEVDNESSLQVTSDRERYRAVPGETAVISVVSPFAGTANVSVQTDRIFYRQVIELKGNAQRISVPVLPAFAPNACVCVHLVKPAAGDGIPAERFGFCEIMVDHPDQHLDVRPSMAAEVVEPGAKARGTVKVSSNGKPVADADVLVFAVDEAVLALGRWHLPDFFEIFFPRRYWKVRTRTALGKLWSPAAPEKLTHSQKGFILGDAGPLVADASFRKDFRPLAFWSASMRSNAQGEVPFEFTAPDALTSYRVVAVAQKDADRFGEGQSRLTLAKRLQIEPALSAFLRNGDEVVLLATVRQNQTASDDINVTIEPGNALVLAEPNTRRVTVRRGEPVVVGFRGKVSMDATRATISFSARSTKHPQAKDEVVESFAVHARVIEQRATVSGAITGTKPLNVSAVTPPEWLLTKGQCDVLISGSPFLPKLAGLPAMLEAQGSIEKLATRILAATLLAETLDYLPLPPDSDKHFRSRVNDGLKRLAGSVLESGAPLWPARNETTTARNDYVTIEAAWAIRSAARNGFEVDGGLLRLANTWLTKIINREIGYDLVDPKDRCFALMVLGMTLTPDEAQYVEQYVSPAEELFNKRDELKVDLEGRAWLALGMHYFRVLEAERAMLMQEISQMVKDTTFNPATFSSASRAELLRFLAACEIESTRWSAAMRQEAIRTFDDIARSSTDLSTHENLWLLLAFNSMARADFPAEMATEMTKNRLTPKLMVSSRNKISAGWLDVPLDKLSQRFSEPLRPRVPGSYLIRATYQSPTIGAPARDTSFSVVRSVRNLTEASRTGTAEAPWKAGDNILVTYTINTDQMHSHLELEDQLPACLETVNAHLPPISENFHLPVDAGANTLVLSHAELRFARTLLYFEKAPPGRNVYSVLGRVIVPGVFHWPSTQLRAMYDSRFYGLSDPALVCAQ
jgi:uncharacterized protein YfaS (alpha-2-macroglobulin family)